VTILDTIIVQKRVEVAALRPRAATSDLRLTGNRLSGEVV
jgi:hypothetical protein